MVYGYKEIEYFPIDKFEVIRLNLEIKIKC